MADYPQPIVSGGFMRRRVAVGVRDVFEPTRFFLAVIAAWLVRTIWWIVDKLAFWLSLGELPAGWAGLLSLGAATLVLLIAPITLSLEGVRAHPLHIALAPPRGDFGRVPAVLGVAALICAAVGFVPLAIGLAWLQSSAPELDRLTYLGTWLFLVAMFLTAGTTVSPRRR